MCWIKQKNRWKNSETAFSGVFLQRFWVLFSIVSFRLKYLCVVLNVPVWSTAMQHAIHPTTRKWFCRCLIHNNSDRFSSAIKNRLAPFDAIEFECKLQSFSHTSDRDQAKERKDCFFIPPSICIASEVERVDRQSLHSLCFRWHVDKLEFKGTNQQERHLFYDRSLRRLPSSENKS